MVRIYKDILTAMFLGFLLPGIVTNTAVTVSRVQEQPEETLPPEIRCPVSVRNGETVTEMELETYIAGVVLAEMPASFEKEALKAQSAAARTYTQKAMITGGKHKDGSVCTDSTCCQGYVSREDYLLQGGTAEAADKVLEACRDTAGMVLVYEGELIEATYFSCSGGDTESAVAVWGTDIPYLQSVSSPGEEKSIVYEQTKTFTPGEFTQALNLHLSGSPKDWVTVITRTDGGGVASMTVGGTTFSGTKLRSLLGLRSTAFTLNATDSLITVTTRGYGHRVGMSQYGAEAMAISGSTYDEILAHYYPGTRLARLGNDGNMEFFVEIQGNPTAG